ncbi:MAG: hypothetical protein ACHP84_03290 [Caulobacterales bacterium]
MRRLILIALSAAALAGCETSGGPSAPGYTPPPPQPPTSSVFRAQDFVWSQSPGRGSIVGTLAFHVADQRYSCAGSDVIASPETPWSRRRMVTLYGSPVSAAVPVSVVRDHTPSEPKDVTDAYQSFARRGRCDTGNHFAFAGLADGAWFVITVAKPVGGQGQPVVVMRRVEMRGGAKSVTLQ